MKQLFSLSATKIENKLLPEIFYLFPPNEKSRKVLFSIINSHSEQHLKMKFEFQNMYSRVPIIWINWN